jgi:hypothetical protein
MINKFSFVSGVVLANASLDIAFHDRVFLVLSGIFIPYFLATTNLDLDRFSFNNKQTYLLDGTMDKNNYNEYIKMF